MRLQCLAVPVSRFNRSHCSTREYWSLLTELASHGVEEERVKQAPDDINIEVRIAREERAIDAGAETLGEPSCYACPDCHGVLLELKNCRPQRFRCHTRHAYTLDALMAADCGKDGRGAVDGAPVS